MPPEMGYDYLGISYQEKKAQQGVPPAAIFGFSLLVVFLILAALYESWSLPFSVLLSTPVAVFGAFLVLWLRRSVLGFFLPPYAIQIENDVYSQIGLVMLIGLAAKNAILIVEFAKDAYERGQPLEEAAIAAARLRLRPILMTSFAFVLGAAGRAISKSSTARRATFPPSSRSRRHSSGSSSPRCGSIARSEDGMSPRAHHWARGAARRAPRRRIALDERGRPTSVVHERGAARPSAPTTPCSGPCRLPRRNDTPRPYRH
jgi:hypothetical protein